jgi:glycosyltransferase involved in cell wall biosynthesis
MSDIKILFNSYPTAFQKMGGGEKQIEQYYNFLKKKNFYVKKYNQWSKYQKINNFDIIHFFSVIPGGSLDFLRYAKNQNKKIVISPNIWLDDKKHDEFNQIKYILHLVDIIIVNSEIEKRKISNLFDIDYSKIKVIFNFVDNNYFDTKKFEENFVYKFNVKKPYLLTVGNIEKRKNQNAIIEILHKFPNLNFVNIGNIRDENYLKSYKGKTNKIYLIKYQKNKNILKSAYEGSDIFILPSLCETPSIAALEAACMNKKIIITSVGSTTEYFKNYVSYIDTNNSYNLEKVIKNLLIQKKPKFLKKYIINNFIESIQMPKLIKIYKDLHGNSN